MQIKDFRHLVWEYYWVNKRDLPWRNTKDPYKILVAEIMLQQTQVSRVLQKYPEFLKTFPNFKALSKSSNIDVLKVWKGMGYNRRALCLKKIAELIIKNFNGEIPKDPKILQTFPGIGYATSCSIVVFIYNSPLSFIETNIRRVFIHYFFQEKEKVSDKEIRSLVEKTLDKGNPKEWYYALMDYESHLAKTQSNPNRKSTHYTKQSKFEGSARQLRGKILKELLLENKLSKVSLQRKINDKRIAEILVQLEEEGFVQIKNNSVSLAR